MIPWPDSIRLDILSMTISALPSMICAKVSKGEVFSVRPSPLSKDMILIFPVDFLIIVLITTELGIYSIISTMMCDFDFSSSALSNFFSFWVWSIFFDWKHSEINASLRTTNVRAFSISLSSFPDFMGPNQLFHPIILNHWIVIDLCYSKYE